MDARPDIGFESYDRFFPSQDTLPHGGFGNLIALPLQKQAREHGNSVFRRRAARSIHRSMGVSVHDPQAESEPRLRRLLRTASAEATSLVFGFRPMTTTGNLGRHRRRAGESIPPADGATADVDRTDPRQRDLRPERRAESRGFETRLFGWRRFRIPEFYKSPGDAIGHVWQAAHRLVRRRPLGSHRPAARLSGRSARTARPVEDCAARFATNAAQANPSTSAFHGSLRPDQQKAADALVAHDTGVLAATTAFGKTVVAAWLIARRGVNTLVLVHRRQLLDQWVDRLSAFLGLPHASIGRIGGGRNKPTGRIDVAVIQSLVRKGVVDDRVGNYGHLIVDECHHLSAHSFEQVARRAKARFVLGLSATVTRKDGHQPIIFMQCGPVRHRVDAKAQAALRPFRHSVIVRPTSFVAESADAADKRVQFQSLYKELVERRNAQPRHLRRRARSRARWPIAA